MLLWTIIRVSISSLMGNKMRSFLAMLGIIIGVGAVISMLALGAGAKKKVVDRVAAMGTNLLIVRPGSPMRGGVRGAAARSLSISDADMLMESIEEIDSISPVVMGRAQVKYLANNSNTNVTGASYTYFDIRGFEIAKGRSFNEIEEERKSTVVVLGHTIAKDLLGDKDPVGETIRLKNLNFRVVGVLKEKGEQGWFSPDEMVVIPYSTAMKRILGQSYLSEIDIMVKDGIDLSVVEVKAGEILRKRHKILAGKEDDFNIRNQAEMIEVASNVTKTFTFLLGGIASISLVVGGIGIMNIMLVTVTERTREIGVRKAIGARPRDILRQFLIESILISGLGGFLGIGAGVGVAELINHFSEYGTVIEMHSILLSLIVSGSVGVFFGYYPARRAASLNPIEALRYE